MAGKQEKENEFFMNYLAETSFFPYICSIIKKA